MNSIPLLLQASGMSHSFYHLHLQHSRGQRRNHRYNDNLHLSCSLSRYPCSGHLQNQLVCTYRHANSLDPWYNSHLDSVCRELIHWMLAKSVSIVVLASCNLRLLQSKDILSLWRWHNWLSVFHSLLAQSHYDTSANKDTMKLNCRVY